MAPDHAEARDAVAASPAALEVNHRLSAAHGPLPLIDTDRAVKLPLLESVGI